MGAYPGFRFFEDFLFFFFLDSKYFLFIYKHNDHINSPHNLRTKTLITSQLAIYYPILSPVFSLQITRTLNFGLPSWLSGKESACKAGDQGSIPGLGRSHGGGHGNPFQYSSLENSMDRGAWRATVHRVAQCWTQLKRLSSQQQP